MARNTGSGQDDFFENNSETRQNLATIYALQLEENHGETTSKAISEAAYDSQVFPIFGQREANVLLRMPNVERWLNQQDSSGIQRGYKTPQATRTDWARCTQSVLQFDIEFDANQVDADRKKIRRKIVALLGRYPDAEVNVASWIWSTEDTAWLKQSLRQSGAPLIAD